MTGKTIVLIERCSNRLGRLEAALAESGFRVITACDADSGLAQAKAHKPDIVVLNTTLGEVPGVRFVRSMRNETALSTTPVVFLSPLGTPPTPALGPGLSPCRFLSCDVAETFLVRSIEEALKDDPGASRPRGLERRFEFSAAVAAV